ncbi:MAG: hypothetical protein Q9175_004768 [Cornicularia normoerica]
MDPLSISASIAALLQLTSTVIQYLNGVKGAPEDRRMLLSELASVNGFLFILQDQADQAKQGDQWSSTLQSLNVPEGPLDQFRRALERLSSKLASPATGLKRLGKAVTWPFQKEEIKEILGSIERQKSLLNLARQNDHMKLSKAIKIDVASMRDEVEEVANKVSRIQMSQITSEDLTIIEWLAAPDPSTNYNRALKDRNPKTGSWFIESSAYADWKVTPRSFLWLYGIPGCGKTILSSTILQNVLEQYHAKPTSAVLYFYFDFNDAEKQRHEKMIRSLICQLSMYCAVSVLQNLHSSCLSGRRQPTWEVLLNTLRQMTASLEDIYIILDALDECAERDELLTDLEEIVSWEDANLHVLTTSRRKKDIEEALTLLSDERNRIGIQSALVNADIRTYTHDRLQIDRKLRRWLKRPEVQLEIEDTLMKKADGMFRWAACQLDSLGDCFHLPHLRHALASLPKTLDDTYARILCNIDKRYSHYNKHILKILQWLTFSTRPLRLEELAEVFAIDIDETSRFDPGRRLPEPRDILTLCSSLITLTNSVYDASDEGSGSVLSEDSQDPDADSVAESSDSGGSTIYVRLAHFSVKEYLVSDRIQHGAAPRYSIREIESHAVLAEDCIAYLLQFDEPGSLTLETLGQSPLAGYAAQFWFAHAKVAEKGPIQTATVLSMKLFMAEGEGFLNWIRIFDSDRYGQQNLRLGLNDLASPIYYASLAGVFESVKMLIERSMDVNAQGGRYGNTLQAASYRGHIDIVRLLLDNGANVNAQGGRYGNALQTASDCEDIDIVRLLLDNGADVNAQGGHFGNALQAASDYGDIDIVRLLLEKGADVNALGDGFWGSALQVASKNGHENVAKMLIAKGAVMPKEESSESEQEGESSESEQEGESSESEQEGDPAVEHIGELEAIATPAVAN